MNTFFENLNLRQQLYLVCGLWTALLAALTIAEPVLASLGLAHEVTTRMLMLGKVCAVLFMFGFSALMGRCVGERAEQLVSALQAMAKGDLTRKVTIKGKDEFAWMAWEYSCARKEFSKIIRDVISNAGHLAAAAEELSGITEQSKQGVTRQNMETEQVATAINEMSSTVQEVARNAATAAQAAQDADHESKSGQGVVRNTIETINNLAHEVERTSGVIAKLKDDSLSIGAVLDVIRGIAEQTNLLALNAAIEAARAGEQGRGFAVVADEVRSLASRTQQSTQEIQDMIERLQVGANEAVSAMEQGRSKADACVQQAAKAGSSLESITAMVDRIKEMNTQIASAAEEQSATTEEINRNVVNISEISAETSQGAEQTAQASDELARLAVQLQGLVGKFKFAEG